MMRRLIVAGLISGALMAGQVEFVAAASSQSVVTQRVVKSKVASVAPSKSRAATQALIGDGTTRCYYAYWIAEARNAVSVVLFQYKEQVEWCARDGRIRSAIRWTQPITPRPWLWQYATETLFEPSYNDAKSRGTFDARGTFNQVVPTIFGWFTVGQSHPRVSITVRASGLATGSVSW